MNMTRITYPVLCVYMDGKVSNTIYDLLLQLFFKTDRLFEVTHPTGSHIHPKSGSIKEMARDRHTVRPTTHH